jgi:two-component system LytT family response regulator
MLNASLRAIVVDDDPGARTALQQAVEAASFMTVVGVFADGEAARQGIRRLQPDIVFLDIDMPPPDGMEIASALTGEGNPAVVFVTAHDRFAVAAFELHAVDYVLKPFADQRIAEAAERALRRVAAAGHAEIARRFGALLQSVRVDPTTAVAAHGRRFLVRQESRFQFVPVDSVDWIEADGNYVWLHVQSERFRLRGQLSDVLASLDPGHFIRIHRSHAVNIERVREVQPWFNGDYIAILHDGRTLRVSRTFRTHLLKPIA